MITQFVVSALMCVSFFSLSPAAHAEDEVQIAPPFQRASSQWSVTDGEADLEGEEGPTAKMAKANWKSACENWKKELKEENKDGKVLASNCGVSTCSGDAGHKICTSKATYKLKVKAE